MHFVEQVIEKRLSGQRLTLEDAILLYQGDILTLGKAADTFRRQLHPENLVTFVIDHLISYTNVCVEGCSFCNFSQLPGSSKAHTMAKEEIFGRIQRFPQGLLLLYGLCLSGRDVSILVLIVGLYLVVIVV